MDCQKNLSPSLIVRPDSSPSPIRRAVIDVGTNSIKLLVADVTGPAVIPISEHSKQTRLGHGFFETHLLHADAIAATAEAVKRFCAEAKLLNAAQIRVIATSAARDARNASELIDAIRASSGLEVEIISGEQEADWAFRGVASDPKFSNLPLLIIDVGGGSTEVILGQGTRQFFRNSYQMGTVRLLEQLQPGDPPGNEALEHCRRLLRKFFNETIRREAGPALKKCSREIHLIGTGGTTTILARMEKQLPDFDREKIEATKLTPMQLRAHIEKLWNMTLEARKTIIGLPPKRADVILTGTTIYEAILEGFQLDELQISTRGLRYAAVQDEPKSLFEK